MAAACLSGSSAFVSKAEGERGRELRTLRLSRLPILRALSKNDAYCREISRLIVVAGMEPYLTGFHQVGPTRIKFSKLYMIYSPTFLYRQTRQDVAQKMEGN